MELDNLVGQPSESNLLSLIAERQKRILFSLPSYLKKTVWAAFTILLLGILVQLFVKPTSAGFVELFKFESPTLGNILVIFFTFFAYIMNCVFAVWALSFAPFLVIQAFKVSQQLDLPIRMKSFKWIQLFASSLFPPAVFAMFWTNLPAPEGAFIINMTVNQGVIILVSSLIIWGILYLATRFVPLRYILIHLSIFSTLLYATLFVAYGLGIGIASYATLLGMFFYLMFSFDKLNEIGKRICLFDIDSKIAEKIHGISSKEDDINVRKVETETRKLDNNMEAEVSKLSDEEKVATQLKKINKTRIEFNATVNDTILNSFNQRTSLLNQMYKILSNELTDKMNEEIPHKIEELKNNAEKLSPEQLGENMDKIINEMNTSLERIPKSLEQIKQQMIEATNHLRLTTQQLANEKEKQNAGERKNDFNMG